MYMRTKSPECTRCRSELVSFIRDFQSAPFRVPIRFRLSTTHRTISRSHIHSPVRHPNFPAAGTFRPYLPPIRCTTNQSSLSPLPLLLNKSARKFVCRKGRTNATRIEVLGSSNGAAAVHIQPRVVSTTPPPSSSVI